MIATNEMQARVEYAASLILDDEGFTTGLEGEEANEVIDGCVKIARAIAMHTQGVRDDHTARVQIADQVRRLREIVHFPEGVCRAD